MAGYNLAPARQAIVHGDCWPVTTAAAHLVRSVLPDCDCVTTHSLPALLQQLARKPRAVQILCLRPREHLFLFHALKQVLPDHPVLVISDELFFSDQLVLKVYGDIPVMPSQELTELLIRVKQGKPWPGGAHIRMKGVLADFLLSPAPVTGYSEVPLIFTSPEQLMDYMAVLMHREMLACGVSPAQFRLLQEVYRGRGKLSALSGRLNTGEKQIWQDKYQLLSKLGMRNRMRELLFGTRFCESLQRTLFITGDERHRKPAFEGCNLNCGAA
ncbi:transcriptional regulator [Salmonella enterica]|nr:transcriptional regulator [Salmonella enterica]EBW1593242.1 transcriptional regulator [Salmonella enterica subsp. diarizonae serovar 61:r:z]EDR7606929.1 transcriptional regulator [Salmonella enterica subsp. diarizonae]EAT8024287.1 transcriptional regulator [Salmonella enterica]EBB6123551.1 transcriptional regulator [Salmonella enterica]